MPTPAGETGIGPAAGRIAEHARRLVQLELELAKSELRRKATAAALGIGFAVGAALFGLFALAALVAAATAAVALMVPVWAAVLAIGVGLLLLAGALGGGAMLALRRGTPPVPEQAIEEARLTTDSLRSNGHRH